MLLFLKPIVGLTFETVFKHQLVWKPGGRGKPRVCFVALGLFAGAFIVCLLPGVAGSLIFDFLFGNFVFCESSTHFQVWYEGKLSGAAEHRFCQDTSRQHRTPDCVFGFCTLMTCNASEKSFYAFEHIQSEVNCNEKILSK